MNIGIQGIKGAFHEEAALKHFGEDIRISPYFTFSKMVQAILEGRSDSGMMAIENTISGTIHANLRLITEAGLQITGEEYLRIEQNLVALPGNSIDQIKTISSHYMALEQCREFLDQYPEIRLVDADDTAMVMKQIADTQDSGLAAIGSRLAAKHYGLEIIAKGIETNKKNYTRFLVIQKERKEKDVFNKSSISLILKNKKGVLSQILSIIAFYEIDLSKIESVPIVGEPWHYRFYIDLLFDDVKQYRHMLLAIQPLLDEILIMGEYVSAIQSFNQIHEAL
jgi:prephenate dehydratase